MKNAKLFEFCILEPYIIIILNLLINDNAEYDFTSVFPQRKI